MKIKFDPKDVIKKFKGTYNTKSSCYFHVTIRFLLCHPCFYHVLKKKFKSEDLNEQNPEIKDWTSFFKNLYRLSQTSDFKVFQKLYEFYNKKIRNKDSGTDSQYSMQDPRQEIITILNEFNKIVDTEEQICSSIDFCHNYEKIYQNDGSEEFELQNETKNIEKQAFLSYHCEQKKITTEVLTGKSDKVYNISVKNPNLGDVVMFQSIKTFENNGQNFAKIKKKDGSFTKILMRQVTLNDIKTIYIGDDEYVLLSVGLHRSAHWTMVGIDVNNNNATLFNDGSSEEVKNLDEIKEYDDFGPLMFIKKSSLINKTVNTPSIEEKKEELSSEQKKLLAKNINDIETKKIICMRDIIKKAIESGLLEEECFSSLGLNDFFKNDNQPVVNCKKNFDTDVDENFSPNNREKLLTACEIITNILKQDKNMVECANLILRQGLSDISDISNDLGDIEKNKNLIIKYLDKKKKIVNNEKDNNEKDNITRNYIAPQQNINRPPNQVNNIEQNSNTSNIGQNRDVSPVRPITKPTNKNTTNYKNTLGKGDEIYLKNKKEIEKANNGVDTQIKQEEINMQNIGKRPVIEFWVYLLCLLLIGFYILYLKKEKIKKWDEKKANYDNKMRKLQRIKNNNTNYYNLKNFGKDSLTV